MIPTALTQQELRRKSLEFRADLERRRRAQEMAEAYKKSFRQFIPAAWNTVEPAKPFIPSFHVDAIAEHLQAVFEQRIQKLLITIFPGSAKSVISAVMFPAWAWTRDPGWRSTFASYESTLSTRDSVRCRDLLESVWYQETFRPGWKFATDQNEKTYYVNTAKGFRMSTSVTGRGSGWRGHCILADDCLNAADRFSDAKLSDLVDWWDNTMFNRLIDLTTGAKVIIMQRLGDRDLAGHVLRAGGYDHLKIPLEYDPVRSKITSIGWEDPRKDPSLPRIVMPELFPTPVVEDLKNNQEAWSSQYQQEPAVEGGGILKSHKWNYWRPAGMTNLPKVRVKMPNGDIEERTAVELPDRFDMELMSWDAAFKDLKTSDFVCGITVGVRGPQRFITAYTKKRMGIVETMNAMREMTADQPKAHLKLIEDKANGPAVVEMLATEIPGLVLVNPEGGKVARAVAGAPELEAGNWYLPHPLTKPWVGNPENPTDGGFIASTVLFPYGANDDDVDAWSQAAIRIQKEPLGGLFRVSDHDIRVDPIEIGEKWPRLFGLAVTWQEVAAVWMCRRPETDQHYLYHEYLTPPSAPSQQITELFKPGDWIHGLMTPTDTGRELKDGYDLVSKYRKLNLKLDTIPENPETMILELQEALRTGKLKVFSSLPRLFDQFRMYRRGDNGRLPTYNCGMVKAMMVAWAGRNKMKGPPEPPKPERASYTGNPPQNTWMSH